MPLLIVVGGDGKSVRVFQRLVDGRELQLFAKPKSPPLTIVETGSEWDFTGLAIGGSLSGKRLERMQLLIDYWFDWKTYHSNSDVHELAGSPE